MRIMETDEIFDILGCIMSLWPHHVDTFFVGHASTEAWITDHIVLYVDSV